MLQIVLALVLFGVWLLGELTGDEQLKEKVRRWKNKCFKKGTE